jgi:predicted MFS family arabinose efflux permease
MPTDQARALPGFDPAASAAHPLLSGGYKAWLVFALLLVSTLNFADRAVLSVLAQAIKEDLKLTDADLGMLQGLGFAILYSILGLPLGWLAERVSRKGLIAVCVAVWSVTSAACGFASSFLAMLLCRVGVGVGEAGFQPATSSLLADHFGPKRRASMLAVLALGAPFGLLVGQSVGGWVAAEWNWRAAFVAVGAPGLAAALVVWLGLKEPPRGLVEGHVGMDRPPSLRSVLVELWSKPSFRHLLVGFTVSGFTYNAVSQFVLPFYLRSFGLPLAVVGVVFGTIGFTSNGSGMLIGGFGFDWLARRDARWLLWGPAAMLVVGMPLYAGAFASTRAANSFTWIWLSNFVLASYVAPTGAAVQNLAGPRMRALAASLFALAAGVVGAGLGPTVLGLLSDGFAAHAFHQGSFVTSCPGGRGGSPAFDAACRAASRQGLRDALVTVQVVYLWAAIHYLLAARTFRRDLFGSAGGDGSDGAPAAHLQHER